MLVAIKQVQYERDKQNQAKSDCRGFISLYREYFGIKKSKFGYVGERVVMIPPINIANFSNVYLLGNNSKHSKKGSIIKSLPSLQIKK